MRFIKLNSESVVIAIRFGTEIVDGEIQSDNGELGQRMLSDGTFEDVPIETIEPTPSIEEEILFENKYQTMLLEMASMS